MCVDLVILHGVVGLSYWVQELGGWWGGGRSAPASTEERGGVHRLKMKLVLKDNYG